VSGIDMNDIYSEKELAAFELAQMTFADIFSNGIPIDTNAPIKTVNTEIYLQLTTEEHRRAFFTAVHTLVEQLNNQTPTCVFCHRGLGRSPLVVAAATQQFYRESMAEAIARTLNIRPSALFTDISLSALQWYAEQHAKPSHAI
jgi:predicted protein tyrosine phosphatase